jgi:tetratricopeptide (TPR) repeat protein
VRFALGSKETLKYHKQFLELAEKIDDKREYAEALVRLAYDYSEDGQDEKADEYTKKAMKICEDIGYVELQAEIMMDMAHSALCNEGVNKALEYYQKALELYEKSESEKTAYRSVCRSAISLLNEVGKYPGIDNLIEFRMLADEIEKTSEGIIFLNEPGFGICKRRTDYVWEKAFVSLLFLIKTGDKILDYFSKIGDKQTMEEFSFTFKPLIATRFVESDSEILTVIAGKFDNCIKIKGEVRLSPDDKYAEDSEYIKGMGKLNQIYCGIKQIWFAPGVGPVKFIFDTGDDVHIHIELAEYEIKESQKSDYFPLSVGNKWTYRSCGIDERYVNKIYYEVAGNNGNIYYLDHYAYAYFSGSKDEYDNLSQNKQ